jgi:XTP/dITP diphosphohydrolase
MKDLNKRSATFESVVAFCSPKLNSPKCFHGKIEGRITERISGFKGFGFDPVFLPEKGRGKTFAEMPIGEKNEFSHRAKALRRFADWYVSKF